MRNMSFLKVSNLTKIYKTAFEVYALNDVSFEINEGELVVILGSSGAGKSTLLNILGGMDNATSGEYQILDECVSKMNAKELMNFRLNDVGFVFQFYNLMPNLNALENVMLAHPNISDNEALDILTQVGLKDRCKNFPEALSGGEQQRVAIARALVKKPKIILCDEPTGALDSKTGVQILEILYNMAHVNKKTVIIVTHNANIALMADRVIKLKDGKIILDEIINNPSKVSDIKW